MEPDRRIYENPPRMQALLCRTEGQVTDVLLTDSYRALNVGTENRTVTIVSNFGRSGRYRFASINDRFFQRIDLPREASPD
jgi:hypothetical protein